MSSRAGATFERLVWAELVESGLWFVVRSAGSNGPVDLVALPIIGCRHTRPHLLQCKRALRIDTPEWNDLYDLAHDLQAVPVIVYRLPRHGIVYEVMTAHKSGIRGRPRPAFPVALTEP